MSLAPCSTAQQQPKHQCYQHCISLKAKTQHHARQYERKNPLLCPSRNQDTKARPYQETLILNVLQAGSDFLEHWEFTKAFGDLSEGN